MPKKLVPQCWHTSNGDFATYDAGEIELVFPEFSSSKSARFEPDIIYLPENAQKPHYDMIIGTESLEKLNVIMDFEKKNVNDGRFNRTHAYQS